MGNERDSQAGRLLSHDHQAVGEVMKQLGNALAGSDVPTTFAKLDLLWARLAVHIRAEHLHLFPVVMRRLIESPVTEGPDLNEAQSVVDTLRADHDFFMRELAQAVSLLRALPQTLDGQAREDMLISVRNSVHEVEKRLAFHNEIEESGIYKWAGTMLTEAEQIELSAAINEELEKRPTRFSLNSWRNTEITDTPVS